MSLDQVLALGNPEDSIDALADPLWHRVEDDWTGLSFAEQVIFGIWSFKVEVCNGGLAQFFFNAVGEATPQVIEGLKQISAYRVAEILETALCIIGTDVPLTDWSARQTRVDSLTSFEREKLSALDDEFYHLLADTMQKARAFVLAHRREFRDVQTT